jgi:GNAT superfamily N-acetyltransferase
MTAIRPANSEDAAALNELGAPLLLKGPIFVAENNLGAIGMIECGFVNFEPFTRPAACVYALFVTPSHRRRGIGRSLLAAAGAWAKERGETKINITVRSANVAALRLYQRVGFIQITDVVCNGGFILLEKKLRPLGDVDAVQLAAGQPMTTPISNDQLAMMLHAARQVPDDQRDEYFACVAAALRMIPHFSDSDVAAIVRAAFSKYAEGAS